MSQYITIDDRLIEFRQAHREVVTGTLSKISVFRSSLSLGGPPKYVRQKVSLRVRREQDLAITTHEQSLHQNYAKLKHNLQVYARCKSMKLERAFERQTAVVGERPRQDLARLSYKSEKEDRTIFIDRKYNRQFAISSAIAEEITAITEQKVRMRKLMSQKHVSPLARQARARAAGSVVDGEGKGKGNPVLAGRQEVSLRKKRKGHEYHFGSASRNRK